MEVQVQELIEKIKNDGIQSAEKRAEEIISEAQNKAASIVRDGERKTSRRKLLSKRATRPTRWSIRPRRR